VSEGEGVRFLDDGGMDFAVRCLLTGVRYGMAEVGEILQTTSTVVDGDSDSWLSRWLDRGRRLGALAAEAEAAGRRYSAWGAYLRGANYVFAGNWYAPATDRPTVDGWRIHRGLWDGAVRCWPSHAEPTRIPFDGEGLPGYWFDGDAPPDELRPVVVIVNGVETPMSDTTMTGLADGLARGYRILCFDGPGQGAALYEGGLELTGDWPAVLAAVVDHAVGRPGVDRDRVSLMGVAEGGLFAARGAGHDDRIAALVLDPGVNTVLGDVLGSLPDGLVDRFRAGAGDLDDQAAALTDAGDRLALAKARAPLPRHSLRDALERYRELTLTDADLDGLRAPTFVALAEAAESYPGQSLTVAAALEARGVPVTLERFTAAEGAALDCEIMAPQVRNQRVYDWLDATLGVDRGR
jgi:hypothetical protein